MTDIDPILDAIDHCLTDYAVSGDAMRWTPDAPDPGEIVASWYDETHLFTQDEPSRVLGEALDRATLHGIALPSWVADYEPPDTSGWERIGYVSEPIELHFADSQPQSIGELIREGVEYCFRRYGFGTYHLEPGGDGTS